MGRAELNLHVLSQSRRKSFLQGREFCLSAHSVIGPRARGDDNQGGRNDFLRFQEQLLRRKKQELFFGVSVGNGVRGGITLSSKSKKIFYAHKLFYCLETIFMPTNCTNGHESLSMGKMATCTVARICTNAMRDGCLGHVLWRSAFQAHRPHLAY